MLFINLETLGLWLLSIIIPIMILYIFYLILTKPFEYMGFSTLEAIVIVLVSLVFRFEIFVFGFNISNIYLFSYNNWMISINMGGAVIPVLLSFYLKYKKDIPWKKILVGVVIVAVTSFFVTHPVVSKGIVASFPYWLLPAFFASLTSIFLSWKTFRKAAPLAYISGTLGVLIGADVFHLPELLGYHLTISKNAIIGGANVFDMIYLTGILAVIVDGIIMFKQRAKEGID